jgi:hypothetical protein
MFEAVVLASGQAVDSRVFQVGVHGRRVFSVQNCTRCPVGIVRVAVELNQALCIGVYSRPLRMPHRSRLHTRITSIFRLRKSFRSSEIKMRPLAT